MKLNKNKFTFDKCFRAYSIYGFSKKYLEHIINMTDDVREWYLFDKIHELKGIISLFLYKHHFYI